MRHRPEHWNRSTQTLVVYAGKSGRTRTIPLSAPAAEALADLEAVGAIGPFSTSTVRRGFIRAAARLGIRGVRPYDLRHSYGTALYRVACDRDSGLRSQPIPAAGGSLPVELPCAGRLV